MKELVKYLWQNRLLGNSALVTESGERVEVMECGLPTAHDSKADFIHATLMVDDALLMGNIKIDECASQWKEESGESDNIILHVVERCDAPPHIAAGRTVPQLKISCDPAMEKRFALLTGPTEPMECKHTGGALPQIVLHNYMEALLCERLSDRSGQIAHRLQFYNNSWEDAFFCTLARNFGFGVNGDAFEQWMGRISLRMVDKHRDNLFQVEALFLGQAGLLEPDTLPEYYRAAAAKEGYFERLRNEYLYLAHKFELQPGTPDIWNFKGMRPGNYPHVRLAQLAAIYHTGSVNLSRAIEAATATDLYKLLDTRPSPYWEQHFIFGSTPTEGTRRISRRSLDLLIINTVVPFLYAYGKHKNNDEYLKRAESLLAELAPEDNYITRMWAAHGIAAQNAAQSQALIQLKKCYCDRRNCVECRLGYEFLKG